jgi:nucleoside-diphosphate kinase
MAKPDCTQRGLVGTVVSKFEQKGFKLVAMKMLVPPRALVEEHYSALKSKPFFGALVDFLVSGPVVAMCWEGAGVIAAGRKLIGATNPLESDPSTLRGAHGIDVGRNIVHGSDTEPGSAEREISLWFDEAELCDWTPTMGKWIYE